MIRRAGKPAHNGEYTMDRLKPYTVSQDRNSGAWYCHRKGHDRIPVFGSIGDKKKAQSVCRLMNQSARK